MQFISQNLVHLAALFTVVCFLFRDQIKLRTFAAVGDALLSVYYFVAFAEPLWNPMAWSILNVIINVTMIGLILRDGRGFEMSDAEMNLFRNLDGLSPGQFRKLVKLGNWHHAEDETLLTTESETPSQLFYVLEGPVMIAKGPRNFAVEPRQFIGELSLLRQKPASATVRVGAGAHYVAWARGDLEKLFAANDDMRNTMNLILSRDIAEKVANT